MMRFASLDLSARHDAPCVHTDTPATRGTSRTTDLHTIAAVAYDEELADRLRKVLAGERRISERRMFGGLAFLVNGNMAIAASGQGGLLVRVHPADTAALVRKDHVKRFAMRGREMDGWIRVDAEGARTRRQLEAWARRGVAFARSLPPKR